MLCYFKNQVVQGVAAFLVIIGIGLGTYFLFFRPKPPSALNMVNGKSEMKIVPGQHDMPLLTFIGTHPKTPTNFILSCAFTNYYNYEFARQREDFYSIAMQEFGSNRNITGYVLKDSPLGNLVLETLRDGKGHWFQVNVSAGESPQCVLINSAKIHPTR